MTKIGGALNCRGLRGDLITLKMANLYHNPVSSKPNLPKTKGLTREYENESTAARDAKDAKDALACYTDNPNAPNPGGIQYLDGPKVCDFLPRIYLVFAASLLFFKYFI